MFRCWGSSAIAVAPTAPTNHAMVQPSTTTHVRVQSSSSSPARRYAWNAPEVNTQTVATSAFPTTTRTIVSSSSNGPARRYVWNTSEVNTQVVTISILSTTTQLTVQSSPSRPASRHVRNVPEVNTQTVATSILPISSSSSSSPILSVSNKPRVYSSFEKLPTSLIVLILGHLSIKECSITKSINHLVNSILNSDEYADEYVRIYTQSFHHISQCVNAMWAFAYYKTYRVSKPNSFQITNLLDFFKINSLINYLKKADNADSAYNQKLHWLLWEIKRKCYSYARLHNSEKEIDHLIQTTLVLRADLKRCYENISNSDLVNLNLVYIPNDFFKNVTWDALSLLIVTSYLNDMTTSIPVDLINTLADSITEQCVKENHSNTWKKFISNLLKIETISFIIGRKICERVFHNLEKLKKVDEDCFEISNERLRDFFSPEKIIFYLLCNHRYTDEDLLFIRNHCQKLAIINFHDPFFSSDAIEQFCDHPQSKFILDFTVTYDVVYLSNIIPLLTRAFVSLHISTLKMKATDLPILQAWNSQNANMFVIKALILCDHIVIEDAVNKENINKWNDCLMGLGLLQKVKRMRFE